MDRVPHPSSQLRGNFLFNTELDGAAENDELVPQSSARSLSVDTSVSDVEPLLVILPSVCRARDGRLGLR
jgi:hypothetical protein